ncbi:MAG TPA: hypothetical protein VK025_14180 [Steroidobacter sp.]|jgi:hypothetical protein|nr:hypothetical protein [Steroidobacteraceae bacterium]HLS82543.1 hypothetical protein [Steroidobacter sp.]
MSLRTIVRADRAGLFLRGLDRCAIVVGRDGRLNRIRRRPAGVGR